MRIEVSTPGRWCLLAAVSTWSGVALGIIKPLWAGIVALICLLAAVLTRRLAVVVVAIFVIAGSFSGVVATLRSGAIATAEVPEGRVTLIARVAEESSARSYDRAVLEPLILDGVPWNGPRLAASGLDEGVPVGATVTLEGDLRQRVMRVRDEVVAGVMRVDGMIAMTPSSNPIVRVGNAARRHVTSLYHRESSTDGLVRGLLIGDTDLLSASDEEDLRRAGLAHFIAVSGSNVAMFLVAWWFLTAPIAVRPVFRVIGGVIGLAMFAVVTRWEPSVIRASVMAGTLLVGGLVGIPLDPWMALGTAVTLLLLVSGHLGLSVGFQLSVAATVGVLVGVQAASGRRPRWLYVPLFVTMGAQVAVAPIILAVFGTIPLVAPLANLIVGPMVTFTTAFGALALALPVLKPLVDIGASGILAVSRVASAGPQLGLGAMTGVVVAGAAATWRATRPLGVAAVVIVLMWAVAARAAWPTEPTMVVLDVGQGDAILLQDPSGGTVLVDGGAEPRVLDRALRRNGVRKLTLIVVTHGDLDHVGGVIELLSAGRTSELWIPANVDDGGLLIKAVEAARRGGVTVVEVERGARLSLASMQIDVMGPVRRYAAENDGSVVLWITSGRSVFLGGDVEAVAQRDLPPVRPDIMVVPHHGSRSTDLRWLARTVGQMAILSYGENRYGHPNGEVLAVLEDAGAELRHTYIDGDIVVGLGSTP